jgi:tetratricopeptide (TPR) repeat protein
VSASLKQQLNEARHYLLSQNFSQALARYEKLVRDFPADAVIWFEYGNAASAPQQREHADTAWQKALELAPRNAELIGLIGHQYQGLRQPERARACFVQAAAADRCGINPRISLAVLAEQNHRLQEARLALEECFAIDPNDDQARYFSAVLDRREDKLESAEQRLRDLIRSEIGHPFVRYACRYELAQLLDRSGRYDEAMKQLAEAKQIVRGLTDTKALLAGYDRGAEAALRFTRNLPKAVLAQWAESFPKPQREPVPPRVARICLVGDAL